MTQKELEQFALNEGAAACGGCELGFSPIEEQPKLHYAFSILVKLSDGILKTIENAPTFAYFQHYRAANALLDQIAFKLANEIEKTIRSSPQIQALPALRQFYEKSPLRKGGACLGFG